VLWDSNTTEIEPADLQNKKLIWSNSPLDIFIQRNGRANATPASYSGGPGLKYRSMDRLSRGFRGLGFVTTIPRASVFSSDYFDCTVKILNTNQYHKLYEH
jgi:hypothetical protein